MSANFFFRGIHEGTSLNGHEKGELIIICGDRCNVGRTLEGRAEPSPAIKINDTIPLFLWFKS